MCPSIEDLVVLKELGAGQFGKVLLLSDEKVMLAAKMIHKKKMKE